jgi:hypothetical protein
MWITALLLYGSAFWLLLWSVTSAQLNFLACSDGYSLWAEQEECRMPVLLEGGALAAFAFALTITVVLVRSRRGQSRSGSTRT